MAPRSFDWRNLLLALAAPAVAFALLEGVLALAGVEPKRFRDDPYVGFTSQLPLFVPENSRGTDAWVTSPLKRRLFNEQRFAQKKSRGVRRVFCVGGSTTYGRPYDDSTSFCGWLRELLAEVDGRTTWEVVNAGGISYASYRTALLMEELVRYEPDLFIVYSGHNEFLEKRTYGRWIETPRPVRGLAALASRTRAHAALSRLLPDRAADDAPSPAALLDDEVRTRLDASVGPSDYRRADLQREQTLAHYRFNLSRMVEIARSVDAELLFVTPASNLRDLSPFKSEPGADVTEAEAERVRELLASARELATAGDSHAAVPILRQALAIDEHFADLHYELGRALDRLGFPEEAAIAYRRALEEDVCPLRATGETAEIVRQVATEEKALLVDFEAWIRREAPHGAAGSEHFLDHVHPRIEVHRDLALQVVAELRRSGMLPETAAWSPEAVARVERRVRSGLDRVTQGTALINLSKVLGWAGKLEEAGRLAEQAIAIAPELPEAHYQAGQCALLSDRLEDAVAHYRGALALAPNVATAHGNLAAALEKQGQTLTAIRHYRRAIELLGPGQSAYKAGLIETLSALGATP